MSDILDTIDELDEEDFDDEIELLEEIEDDNTMSEARAIELTNAIRSAATVVYVLLAQAHKHNAHKALGYDTWAEYVREEFDLSAQRSYQLLDLSRVVDEIEAATPEGTEVKITEAQARDIKRELPMVTEKVKAAIEDGEEPEEAIERVIEEVREQKKQDEEAIAQKTQALDEDRDRERQDALVAAADAILGEDDDATSVDDDDDDDSLSPEQSMDLYNFMNVLAGLNGLPEPDDFIKIVPRGRDKEIEEQLLNSVSWLNRFQSLWEVRD